MLFRIYDNLPTLPPLTSIRLFQELEAQKETWLQTQALELGDTLREYTLFERNIETTVRYDKSSAYLEAWYPALPPFRMPLETLRLEEHGRWALVHMSEVCKYGLNVVSCFPEENCESQRAQAQRECAKYIKE